MIAAFRDFQIRIVPRREFDTLRRHQIDEGIVIARRRHMIMYLTDHLLIGLGTGDAQNAGVSFGDQIRLGTHASGDQHLTVCLHSLLYGVQRLLFGAVNKSTGVDHHDICLLVTGRHFIAFNSQLSENAFGIHQCFRAAQRDETNLGIRHAEFSST